MLLFGNRQYFNLQRTKLNIIHFLNDGTFIVLHLLLDWKNSNKRYPHNYTYVLTYQLSCRVVYKCNKDRDERDYGGIR